MVKVAVLGHRGMLGSRVVAALAPRHHVITFSHRYQWPDSGPYLDAIEAWAPDWVINCTSGGAHVWGMLPRELAFRGFRLIQPSTDAIAEESQYAAWKRMGEHGTVIRCGIVDPDGGLLAKVRDADIFRADGLPHWNGITALAWAGVAERVIDGSLGGPLIVPGSPPTSIHDLAVEACYAFRWRTEVVMRPTEGPDRVLAPTLEMPPIRDQLRAYL